MRKQLGAAGLSVTLLAQGAAADGQPPPRTYNPLPPPGVYSPQQPPGVYSYAPPIIRLYSWNGPYIGGHVGAGWNDTLTSGTNGQFIGGAQAGFNLRLGSALLGLEGQWTGSAGNGEDAELVVLRDGVTGTFESDLDWMASLTARLGLVRDRSVWYVKGGPAWARNSFHGFTSLQPGFAFDGSDTRTGWTIGGGYEFAFRSAWSARVEYMFTDFGSDTVILEGPAGRVSLPNVDQQVHAVTFSINYRFDWPTGPLGPN
jgi:outer membrane immunogenic protein